MLESTDIFDHLTNIIRHNKVHNFYVYSPHNNSELFGKIMCNANPFMLKYLMGHILQHILAKMSKYKDIFF